MALRLSIGLRSSVVCMSYRWISQKTFEVRIMKFSPYGSTFPLVFVGQISSRNSKGFPASESVKQGRGGKNKLFSSYKVNISKNSVANEPGTRAPGAPDPGNKK